MQFTSCERGHFSQTGLKHNHFLIHKMIFSPCILVLQAVETHCHTVTWVHKTCMYQMLASQNQHSTGLVLVVIA